MRVENESGFLKLYERARRLALMRGHFDEADDFAQWAMARWLEGKGEHQLLDHALIDYLRERFGGYRTLKGQARQEAEGTAKTLSPTDYFDEDEVEDGGYQAWTPDEHPQGFHSERGRALYPIRQEVEEHLGALFDGRHGHARRRAQIERAAFILHFGWELTEREVGYCFGVSESRVSQIIHGIRCRIKIHLEKTEPVEDSVSVPTTTLGEGQEEGNAVTFIIQKGVPIPPKPTKSGECAAVLGQLQPGDSFICAKKQTSVFFSMAKKKGMRLTSRRTPEGDFRIWRIE